MSLRLFFFFFICTESKMKSIIDRYVYRLRGTPFEALSAGKKNVRVSLARLIINITREAVEIIRVCNNNHKKFIMYNYYATVYLSKIIFCNYNILTTYFFSLVIYYKFVTRPVMCVTTDTLWPRKCIFSS